MAVTYINGAQAENAGATTVSVTVPTGVTTAHFGIMVVVTTNQNEAAITVPSGWTARDNQAHAAGLQTASAYIFTRLGGVAAGNTASATLVATEGATMSCAWYDTSGRDVALTSAIWDTAAADSATVSWNAPGQSSATDVLLVAATRLTGGGTITTPTGITTDLQGIITTQWSAGAYFGHANGVTSQSYSTTWAASAVSHNTQTLQFALTAASGAAASIRRRSVAVVRAANF